MDLPSVDDGRRTWTAEGLTVSVQRRSIEAHVLVSGEIDITSVGTFRSALLAAVRTEASVVVVDLGGVSFLDAQSLGALVTARNLAIVTARRLIVIEASPFAYRIFAITGLAEPFDVRCRDDRGNGTE